MPRLIALKKISSRYPAGAEFETSERNARLLKAIGKAADAPEPVKEAPRRRAEPEPEPAAADAEQETPPRHVPRFYRRRDMKAEDDA